MYLEKKTSLIIQLGFNPTKIKLLQKYIDMLWSKNSELNLFSRKTSMEDLIDNHIIDCLLPLSFFPNSVESVADFGSGGGMPAVLYALQFPEINFYLFEKSPKKQKFLELCKSIAPNIQVMGLIPHSFQEMNIDLVIARGFKPIDEILNLSSEFYSNGGSYFLLKARKEKIDEELTSAKRIFKNLAVRIEKLTSPILDVERNLVLIGKNF